MAALLVWPAFRCIYSGQACRKARPPRLPWCCGAHSYHDGCPRRGSECAPFERHEIFKYVECADCHQKFSIECLEAFAETLEAQGITTNTGVHDPDGSFLLGPRG